MALLNNKEIRILSRQVINLFNSIVYGRSKLKFVSGNAVYRTKIASIIQIHGKLIRINDNVGPNSPVT